jgi:hypothetical membrane protein
MDDVTPNRLRAGAIAWLLTLQFFVVETIAALRFAGPYSRVDDVISDLGTSASASAQLMNASFVLQAALILAGALLLRPALPGLSGRVAPVLLELAAAGVLMVGVFPSDGHSALHATGAVLHLVCGGMGLIALAYSVRPRSEALGTTLALLGLVGLAMTTFFIAGVTQYLGEGGTERAAAYVIPLGLALTGASLWWLDGPRAASRPASARQTAREQARAERAERTRERDEALDAAARRKTAAAEAHDPDGPEHEPHEDDADDPWTTPRRRAD